MRHIFFMLTLATLALGQQPDAQQLAAREFGPSFSADTAFAPMFGDLDGDGQEDAVVVATSKMPLADETAFHYRAVDPYGAYFGWSDPKVTIQFAQTNAGPARYLLVVHNWRSPKAKFLVINVPFDKVGLGRVSRRKKTLTSIHVEEPGGLGADVFWDGKKYRWEATYLGQ